jgi:hypothetical protein
MPPVLALKRDAIQFNLVGPLYHPQEKTVKNILL